MGFAKGIDTIVSEHRHEISDANIVNYYLGVTTIPTRIKSPLRRDRKPSFGLYSRDGEHIYYIDFATGDKGSVIDLFSRMWGTNYNDTWLKIIQDIVGSSHVTINKIIPKNMDIAPLSKNKTTIQVCKRDWKSYDIEYWKSYGISLKWLEFADVYPISHIIFTREDKGTITIPADKAAYAFIEFKEGKTTYKIYQPKNTDGCKWFSSHDRSVISLWTKIPETGDKLVICSSLKDALCLWSNTGIPAISPQGEGYSMSDTAVNELKRRYKEIYILYDNDEAGLKDGKKLAEATGFKNVILPEFPGGKDISDRYKILKNSSQFREEIKQLLN